MPKRPRSANCGRTVHALCFLLLLSTSSSSLSNAPLSPRRSSALPQRAVARLEMARLATATRLAALPASKRVPSRTSTRCYASAAAATSSRTSGTQTLADQYASQESGRWKGTDTVGGSTKLFVGGQFVESKTDRWIDVNDPVSSAALLEELSVLTRQYSRRKRS